MVRCVARATAEREACLPSASKPDVPFCAAAKIAMAVVLARCSAHEGVRSMADSGAAGGTYGTGCRARFCTRCSRGRRPPCLLLLLRPAHVGVWRG